VQRSASRPKRTGTNVTVLHDCRRSVRWERKICCMLAVVARSSAGPNAINLIISSEACTVQGPLFPMPNRPEQGCGWTKGQPCSLLVVNTLHDPGPRTRINCGTWTSIRCNLLAQKEMPVEVRERELESAARTASRWPCEQIEIGLRNLAVGCRRADERSEKQGLETKHPDRRRTECACRLRSQSQHEAYGRGEYSLYGGSRRERTEQLHLGPPRSGT
jgi:hypothetical protein